MFVIIRNIPLLPTIVHFVPLQVGTVIEGNTDFYSGRLTKKERKQTFADELLANTQLKSFRYSCVIIVLILSGHTLEQELEVHLNFEMLKWWDFCHTTMLKLADI
jgi:hypothetical protein